MNVMTNGTTLIKKGAAEFHKLLPRCRDHPALVDDAAKADALLLLELVEPVVVVSVGGRDVGVSTSAEMMFVERMFVEMMLVEVIPVEVMSVGVGVVTELEVERDVVGSVAPSVEPEGVDVDEMGETGEEILVMAKMELVSPESPNKQMM